jgi:hypothetical protein
MPHDATIPTRPVRWLSRSRSPSRRPSETLEVIVGLVALAGWPPAIYSHVAQGPAGWELGPLVAGTLAFLLGTLLLRPRDD